MKKIQEVSKIAGVSIRTLQYYDKENLTNLQRTQNNHRIYTKKDLERIWKILIFKEMDFQIKKIKEILSIPKNEQNTYLEERKEEIKKQIRDLEEKINFIKFIQSNGFPVLSNINLSISYKEYISKLKKELKIK